MARLTLYIDSAGRASLHRTGFSWLAALALPLWALHRRLWRTLIAVSIATPLLHATANQVIELVAGATTQGWVALGWLLGWSALCGARANAWHRRCLERAGYRVVATELQGIAPATAAKVPP